MKSTYFSSCPFLKKQEIWNSVENARKQYLKEHELPVDVELLAERIGLDIVPFDSIPVFEGFLDLNASSIYVSNKVFDDPRYENRLRFTIAHELGHFILHRTLLEQTVLADIDEYYSMLSKIQSDVYTRYEFQANEFAGRLLVPRDELEAQLVDVLRKIPQKHKYLIKQFPEDVLARLSTKVCKPFEVSSKVIEIRAKREGLWPPQL